MIIDNLIAATYNTYAKTGDNSPYLKTTAYVATCLNVVLFFSIFCIKSIFNIDLSAGVIFLLITLTFVTILIVLLKYYTRERLSRIVADFDKKKRGQRMLWGAFALIIFIVPIILIAIMARKGG